ncbi:MAG: hypothetical protein ACJ76J_22475 [Thermoanaerobaculia bacterium]
MQLATGTGVDGKVVVEGETFEVPPELEAELSESITEADCGETISADELIERLRRIA